MNTSLEAFTFVDYHGLDEKITTTAQTPCRRAFRDDALERDGPFCVVTEVPTDICDAVHLVPQSKGDDVRFMIILCDSSIIFCSSTF